MARRTSWTHEQLVSAVASAVCWYDVRRSIGLKSPGSAPHLKKYCDEQGVSYAHFVGRAKKGKKGRVATPLTEILVENSNIDNTHLKRRLIKEGLLEERCYICELTEWQGGKIVLILDHISGTHSDNRIENLRLLCPNCDSQQPTWCGRNNRKKVA